MMKTMKTSFKQLPLMPPKPSLPDRAGAHCIRSAWGCCYSAGTLSCAVPPTGPSSQRPQAAPPYLLLLPLHTNGTRVGREGFLNSNPGRRRRERLEDENRAPGKKHVFFMDHIPSRQLPSRHPHLCIVALNTSVPGAVSCAVTSGNKELS